MKDNSFWKPFIISLIITPIFVFFTILFTGGGHGTYLPVKLLFPYAFISILLFGKVTSSFLLISLAQFPIYGLVLGVANKRDCFTIAKILVFLLHFPVVVLCFVIPTKSFQL